MIWGAVVAAVLVVLGVIGVVVGGDDDDSDAGTAVDTAGERDPEEGSLTESDAGAAGDETDEAEQEPVGAEAADSEDEATEEEGEAAPPPETPNTGGTRERPWAFDAPVAVTFATFGDADGSVWNVTVGPPVDVTERVLADNEFNEPPRDGVAFVGFEVSMTLIEASKVPLSPGFNFGWEFLGGTTSMVYDQSTVSDGFGCGVLSDEFGSYSEVYVGGTLSGTFCIPLPMEDLNDPSTLVAMNFFDGNRVYFGADGIAGAAAPAPSPDDSIGTGSGSGDRQAPHPFGAPTEVTFDSFGEADGSVWTVTIGAPLDITQQVLAENQFNEPPSEGVAFVGFEVELTLVESPIEPVSPGFDFTWELLGGSTAAVYRADTLRETFGCGAFGARFDEFAEVVAGGTLTGTVCIPLPLEDLDHPATQVSMNFSDGERVVFGP